MVSMQFERIFVIAMADRSDKKDVWAMASYFTDFDFDYVDGVEGAKIPTRAVPGVGRAEEEDKARRTMC